MSDLQVLADLDRREAAAGNDRVALKKLEEAYEGLNDGSAAFLTQRNRFRVRHAWAMQRRRPRVLYGRRWVSLANFHTSPLLECADVVFLSVFGEQSKACDQLSLTPSEQTMDDVMARLPTGFMPDLYFDYQVCMTTVHPRGMEQVPFPTFANLCHHYYALRCEALARVFDFVLPLSSTFSRLMAQSIDPAKIINLPFGLAWGSFDHVFQGDPEGPRDIDVLLSFGDVHGNGFSHSGDLRDVVYGPYRRRCASLFETAKAKLGDRYNFVFAADLAQGEYRKLVKRSRISLNAVGINGPYNYRTCETLNLGAVLMQYEPSFCTGPQGMADYLTPDESYVPFDEHDFLPKLEALLTDEPRRSAIARRGHADMCQRYNLRRLYSEFLDMALALPREEWLARRPSLEQAALDRVTAYLLDNRRTASLPDSPDAGTAATQALAAMDLGDAVMASGVHPAAFLMPLYKALRGTLMPGILEGIVGPGAVDLRQDALCFYDRALATLPNPSLVDRFNHLVLCAEEGRIAAAEAQALLDDLRAPPGLGQSEIMRIVSALPLPEQAGVVREAEVAIRNIGHLMAGDAARRSAAAIDFMRFRLCLLLAKAGDREAWMAGANAILAPYRLTMH